MQDNLTDHLLTFSAGVVFTIVTEVIFTGWMELITGF